jgi:hypothetical protein
MTRINYLIIFCWDAASKRITAVLDKNGNCLSLCGLAGRHKQGLGRYNNLNRRRGKGSRPMPPAESSKWVCRWWRCGASR